MDNKCHTPEEAAARYLVGLIRRATLALASASTRKELEHMAALAESQRLAFPFLAEAYKPRMRDALDSFSDEYEFHMSRVLFG